MSKGIVFRNRKKEKIYPCAYYPIGSVYISFSSTNPSNYFGGVWEQIEDKFLLCCGKKYSVGATGGEETHKLTINEIPSHTHAFGGWIDWYAKGGTTGIIGTGASAGNTSSRGGDQPHNNMPPYIAVYVWRRIK